MHYNKWIWFLLKYLAVAPPIASPTPSSSPSNGYIPPKDLYAFPPTDAIYPGPPKAALSSGSSYLPSPSGIPDGYPAFVGPVSPEVLASLGQETSGNAMKTASTTEESRAASPPPSDIPTGPTSQAMDSDTPMQQPSPTASSDDQQMPMPMPMRMPMPMAAAMPSHDHHNHDHSHDHIPYLDHVPATASFDSFPSFPSDHFASDHYSGLHGIDAYPDIYFGHDHDHDHDYFEHHHPEPTTTTTTTEEPEPEEPEEEEPEQPRVKKYSYFYLSRSLWYIPLYFTVWFTFYVTYLILQSIGRHKVIRMVIYCVDVVAAEVASICLFHFLTSFRW